MLFPLKLLVLALCAVFVSGSEIGCKTCVAFMEDAEGELIDIILQVGISEGCSICGRLKSKLEQEVCGVLCEIVGIETFAKVLQGSDIDPIYVCTELFACPRNHCLQQGCTSITNVVVQPQSGPLGTIFNVTVSVLARNATGTGTTILAWKCPTSGETGQPIVNEGFRAGTSNQIKYQINTRLDACLYAPGSYQLTAASCAYDCSDKYGVIYSVSEQAHFTITQ